MEDKQLMYKVYELFLQDHPVELYNYHFLHTLIGSNDSIWKKKVSDTETIDRNASNYEYIRFVEILSILEINIKEFFVTHQLNTHREEMDIKEILDYFIYKIPRSEGCMNALTPFIESLCLYIQKDKEFSSRKDYTNTCAELFMQNSIQIISSYDDFKKYIEYCYIQIFKFKNWDYTQDNFSELAFRCKSMLDRKPLLDIIRDHYISKKDDCPAKDDRSAKTHFVEMLLNRLHDLLSYTKDYSILTALCINWDIIVRIIKNKKLDAYLSKILLNIDDFLKKVVDDEVISDLDQRRTSVVLLRSIDYTYLFNLVYPTDVKAYSSNKIEKFISKKINDSPEIACLILYNHMKYSLFNKEVLRLLYFYGCTIE